MAPPPPASAAGTASPKTRKGIAEWPSQSEVGTAESAGSFGTQKREVEGTYPSFPSTPGQPVMLTLTALILSSRPTPGAPLTGLADLARTKASPKLGFIITVYFKHSKIG